MKDDKAIRILTVLTVTMLTALPVLGFTPYWIYSNVSTTQVGSYQFTLITPQKADMGTTITLQAHLEYHYENGSFPSTMQQYASTLKREDSKK